MRAEDGRGRAEGRRNDKKRNLEDGDEQTKAKNPS